MSQTFAIETYAGRTFNYLDRLVDQDGLPYFNVFWTDPCEAAHDWPDFGDVMTRQLQGAIMARHMTGREACNERVWARKIRELLDAETGLLMRPHTSFSEHVADFGDHSLTMYALATAFTDNGDPAWRSAVDRMVESLPTLYKAGDPGCGFAIKSLMTWFRLTGSQKALEQAEQIVRSCFGSNAVFSPDNNFRHGGHMHGNLRTLVGAADYALYARDPVLFSRIDALYRYVRSTGTRFGFIPEVIGRRGDIVSCETCALMDYLGLAVTLANNGHPEYWGDVERLLRNQLVESQVVDDSWMKPGDQADTVQFSWSDVGARMVGGYAGWSSPMHILAACEELHWGGPELRGKVRAFQNCCGGSGTHALYIAWRNAARFADNTLSVHLHIDKLLPQAEIRCYQPFDGLLTVHLNTACTVRVRIPELVEPGDVAVTSDRGPVKAGTWGHYVQIDDRQAGETLQIRYPVPVLDEEVTIGNPGFRQYSYRVTWKGDTVIRIVPVGQMPDTGYSDFDGRQVAVFYGEAGPGRLYQRESLLTNEVPELAPLHIDDGAFDFWWLR